MFIFYLKKRDVEIRIIHVHEILLMLDMYNANSTELLSHYIQGCIAKKVALSLLSRLFGKLA